MSFQALLKDQIKEAPFQTDQAVVIGIEDPFHDSIQYTAKMAAEENPDAVEIGQGGGHHCLSRSPQGLIVVEAVHRNFLVHRSFI